MTPPADRPTLRHLDTHEVQQGGTSGLALVDPLGLATGQVFVPDALLPIVARFDGAHSIAEIQAELDAAVGEGGAPPDFVANLAGQLDEALMLDSARFRGALDGEVQRFRALGTRPAAHGGTAGLPAEPDACRDALDAILGPVDAATTGPLRGLIAPHIDLARGREGYRAAYRALRASEPADLYVVFGTGHQGPQRAVTGLPMDWATPRGTLRTDRAFVDTIHDLVGPRQPLDEFLHRHEHSIEFQMLFLAHVLEGRDFEVAGFLTGSLPHAERDRIVAAFADAARASGKRVCFVAGADLAHKGPFFGDAEPVDAVLLDRLERDERARLAHIERGDPLAFHDELERDRNPDRVCGTVPITLTAALAGGAGELLHYGQADHADGSQVVSFCSVRFG